jgi:hypothetical protein
MGAGRRLESGWGITPRGRSTRPVSARAPLAQQEEQLPLKQRVRGSSPRRRTRRVEEFGRPRRAHKPEVAGSNPAPAPTFRWLSPVERRSDMAEVPVRIPPSPRDTRVAQRKSAASTRRMPRFDPWHGYWPSGRDCGCSSAGRERRVVAPEVAGSNPVSHPQARRGRRHVQRAVTPPPSGRPGSPPGTRIPCPRSSADRAPDSESGGRWFDPSRGHARSYARVVRGPSATRDTPVRTRLRPQLSSAVEHRRRALAAQPPLLPVAARFETGACDTPRPHSSAGPERHGPKTVCQVGLLKRKVIR